MGAGYYTIAGAESESFGRQWKKNLNKSVMFTFSIPLFNRLDAFRNIRSAGLQVEEQGLIVESEKQELYKDIQHAYYKAIASKEKYLSSEISVEATLELLNQLKEKYALGRVFTYEFNEVRTKWLRADMEKIQAKYEYEFNVRILKRYIDGD